MIGLLGGIGPFATARYYESLVRGHRRRTGRFPELVVVSLDFDLYTELENRDDPKPCIAEIVHGLERLADAGSRIAAITANSPHALLDRIEPPGSLPLVSIVDPVVRCVRRHGFRRPLLLGIGATTRSGLYQRRLRETGARVLLPGPREQERIESIVFDELGAGTVRPSSRRALVEIVCRHPVDAVILGCTELPLLLRPADTAVPLVDSLALHVDAIVDRAARQSHRPSHAARRES